MPPRKQRPSILALDHSGITKERREQFLSNSSSGSSANSRNPVIKVNRIVSNDSTASTSSVEPDLSDLVQLNGDKAPIAESYSLDDQYGGRDDLSEITRDDLESVSKVHTKEAPEKEKPTETVSSQLLPSLNEDEEEEEVEDPAEAAAREKKIAWERATHHDLLEQRKHELSNQVEKARIQLQVEEEESKAMALKLKMFEEEEDREIGYEGEHPATEIGTFRWASGNVYVGELKYGLKDGKGTFNWSSGACYEGDWKNDERNGWGMYKSATSATWVYEGEFQDDKYCGRGTYRWPDGRVYDGMWKDDRQNGHGVVCAADGSVIYEGEWVNGRHADTTVSSGDEVAEITANAQDAPDSTMEKSDNLLIVGSKVKTKFGMVVIVSETDEEGMVEIDPCEWILNEDKPKPPTMRVSEQTVRSEYFLKDTDIVRNQKEWYEQHMSKNTQQSEGKGQEENHCVCS